MPTVAVDAMSGHLGPDEIVKAVAQASLETDIQMLVVGDERQIQPILESIPYNPEHISLHHAPQAIGMDEDPRMAVRHKRKASLPVAARLVAEGQAEALVTAGHTGAAVLACTQHLRLIRGIRKAALASVYPRQTEHAGQDQLALLLDVGATIRCDTPELVQFAVMGNAYARAISKVANPRIALLNMGTDETRGARCWCTRTASSRSSRGCTSSATSRAMT